MTRVLVTGGTGVLGRPVVRSLVANADRVRVLAHTPDNERRIRELGAEPVPADLFDAASVRAVLGDAEAVLHLATRIPPSARMRKSEAWAENDRLRTEGMHNLVDAALAGQVQTFIYPSVVLVYPDSGAAWIDAQTAPLRPSRPTRSTLQAEAEVRRFTDAGRRGITLRMGSFYGPESSHCRDILASARKGIAAVVGRGDAYQPSIWIDDAARAVVACLLQAPSGIYDVVDDEPLQRRDLVRVLAHAVGKSRLLRLPDVLMRLMLGKDLLEVNSRSQRVSNRALREVTGWLPKVPTAREGWPRLAASTGLAASVRSRPVPSS
jgi:nucleoside-diphosphate-sugar epimerase